MHCLKSYSRFAGLRIERVGKEKMWFESERREKHRACHFCPFLLRLSCTFSLMQLSGICYALKLSENTGMLFTVKGNFFLAGRTKEPIRTLFFFLSKQNSHILPQARVPHKRLVTYSLQNVCLLNKQMLFVHKTVLLERDICKESFFSYQYIY